MMTIRYGNPRLLAVIFSMWASQAVALPPQTDPRLTAALESVLDRLDQLEQRLAVLENRSGPEQAAGPDAGSRVVRAGLAAGAEAAAGPPGPVTELAQSLGLLTSRLASLEARLGPGPVASQTPEPPTSESVEDVQPPSATIEKTAYLPSRGWRESMYYGSDALDLSIHSFLDLELVDSGPDGSRDGNSTFDNHHANVFFQADLRPNLTAHTELELEHGGENVEVDQAFLEWTVADSLSLDFGRFYTPFGIERFVWYSPTNALVSRPEPMREIVPNNFYANGIKAQGAVDAGRQATFTYEIAISDGLGDRAATDRRGSRQNRDNNSSRALSARLALAPHRNLEVGTSYHRQRYSTVGDLDLRFLGFDLSGRWNGWEVRAEYVDATLDLPSQSSGAPAGDLEQDGWYAQAAYSFRWLRDLLPSLTLVGRYDEVDLDGSRRGPDDRELFSLGLNALIYDHFRAKLEYRFANESGPELRNDTLFTQFVIDF